MRINSRYKLRNLAGESVLFLQGEVDGETSKLMTFNEASVLLWNNFCNKDFETEDVVNFILSEYEIDEQTARKDAQEWVEVLRNNGVLD